MVPEEIGLTGKSLAQDRRIQGLSQVGAALFFLFIPFNSPFQTFLLSKESKQLRTEKKNL